MQKHLTLEDRQAIAAGLNTHFSFHAIGRVLGKDSTTISREVKRHYSIMKTGSPGHPYNNCIYSMSCPRTNICTDCRNRRCINKCRFCYLCNANCDRYKPTVCKDLLKPPYVCNGCQKRSRCNIEKHFYNAAEAHKRYLATLSEARTGLSLSEDEIHRIDTMVSPLLRQGQSIHHVYVNHKDELMVSEATIYRLVNAGLLTARNIDLPRKVRFAKRKKKKEFKVERACRIGRDYNSFLAFREANPQLPVTQMDTVEGVKGGKVILTVHFVKAECMVAFLRERNDAKSVTDSFNLLYERLTPAVFCRIMPILLGDNGSEFSNPSALETGPDGRARTRVFYCNPSASYQKGSAERNHEFIREFVPKGKSFNDLSQEDINLMMNHINSYKRPVLGDKTPYEMMAFLYGEDVCRSLGLRLIPPDEVTLKPDIFKKGSPGAGREDPAGDGCGSRASDRKENTGHEEQKPSGMGCQAGKP